MPRGWVPPYDPKTKKIMYVLYVAGPLTSVEISNLTGIKHYMVRQILKTRKYFKYVGRGRWTLSEKGEYFAEKMFGLKPSDKGRIELLLPGDHGEPTPIIWEEDWTTEQKSHGNNEALDGEGPTNASRDSEDDRDKEEHGIVPSTILGEHLVHEAGEWGMDGDQASDRVSGARGEEDE